MIKREQIIGIDVGNGQTCYASGNGQTGKFSTLIKRIGKEDDGYGAVESAAFDCKLGRFIVGDMCRELGVKPRSIDTSFYESETYKVAFLKALYACEVKNPYLVIGVPIEFFKELSPKVQGMVKSLAQQEGIPLQGVRCLPQQVALFYDASMKSIVGEVKIGNELFTGKVGLLDIGYGTIDAGQFVDGRPDPIHTFGESSGVSEIHKDLFALLQNPKELIANKKKTGFPADFTLPKQVTVYSMDTFFKYGYIPYKGKEISLGPIVQPLLEQYVDKKIGRVISELWGTTDMMKAIIIGGGGAALLGAELLQRQIHCPILKSGEPDMSVARGLLNVGQMKHGHMPFTN